MTSNVAPLSEKPLAIQKSSSRTLWHWSQSFRSEDGLKQAISEALEIPWVTLRRWRKPSSPDDGQSTGFRPVAAVGEKREPILVSPSGWRIEDLTVAQLLAIAGRL